MQDAQLMQMVFSVLVLVFSVVAHEVSHGYMAQYLGDPTARLAGRLTLNPLRHIDPIGSLLVPFVTSMLPGGVVFGWAKPVPYNPYNLRDQKWGDAKVALSGPLTNLGIAVIFAAVLRSVGDVIPPEAVNIMELIVLINVILTVFNLVPIPPLDGSKVLFNALPLRFRYIEEYFQRYALVLILVFAFFLWKFFLPLIYFLYFLFVGAPA